MQNFANVRNFDVDLIYSPHPHPQDNDHWPLGNPGDKYSGKDTMLYSLFSFRYPLEKEIHSSMSKAIFQIQELLFFKAEWVCLER